MHVNSDISNENKAKDWIEKIENMGLLFGPKFGWTFWLTKQLNDNPSYSFKDFVNFAKSKDDGTKAFKLHWFDNKTEIIRGIDIYNAMNNSGIGNGALRALDFYEELK